MISVAIGMLVGSGVLILLGVLLIYIWKVPTLVAELSGKTSRKNIKKLRKINSSDEMSSTDLYQAMTSGALSEYDLEDHGSGGIGAQGKDLGEILDEIPDEKKRGGRRRLAEVKPLVSSGDLIKVSPEINTEPSSLPLTTGNIGERHEDTLGALDFSEDVSTGYFVDEDEIAGSETTISPFSSTRVVVVTREYSSLNR